MTLFSRQPVEVQLRGRTLRLLRPTARDHLRADDIDLARSEAVRGEAGALRALASLDDLRARLKTARQQGADVDPDLLDELSEVSSQTAGVQQQLIASHRQAIDLQLELLARYLIQVDGEDVEVSADELDADLEPAEVRALWDAWRGASRLSEGEEESDRGK